jgi:hypothetical protein
MSVYSYNAPYALTTDLTTPELDSWGETRFGCVFVPVGSPITTLTFYAAPKPAGTFLPIYNQLGPVTLSVTAGCAFKLPLDLQGCRSVKIVADQAGTVDLSFQEQ